LALELGSELATWTFLMIMARYNSTESSGRHELQTIQQREQIIDRILTARGITYQIPYQFIATCGLGEFPNEISDVSKRVTDNVRVVKSPAHFAFTLIGSATWYLGFMDTEAVRSILPENRQQLRTLAQSDLNQMQIYCSDRFPLGFDRHAVINAIRRAGGSMVRLRQILLDAQKPIVILLVLADPRNEKRLALLDELQRLTESLAATEFRDTFQVRLLANARPDNFAVSLSRMRPTIIHFSGHGSSNGLTFSDPSGRSVNVVPDRLASLLTLARRDGLKAVVMNACYTADQARVISTAVQDVVVMDGELSDAAAIQFSAEFYAQLGNGRSFREAFEWTRDADLTGAGGMDAHLISTQEE
jgi:CHAT domain